MAEQLPSKVIVMFASNNIIRLQQVIKKVGLSRSTIYALVSRNEFPQRIQLSPRSMGFLESEVDQWLADKVAARNEVKGA